MTWPPRTRSARVRARFVLTALAVLATACSYTTDLRLPDLGAESSVVFSADGALLATLHAEENREVVALDAISPYLRNAVVAIEDARFFDHEGVDLRAIARALKRDAEEGQIVEGGSTITQQYVRAVMLDDSKTFSRKLREAVLAFQVERTYTKEEILERYLNTVYFGNGAYGAQAAARVFFGKDAIDLELAEAALLAGVLQAPEDLNPFADADAARRRRDRVLDRMEELGRARPSDVAEARRAPLPETPSGPSERYPAGHFVERVKQFVLEDPRFGETPEARRHLLFQGGLRIETTLDPTVQALAEMAVARVLSDPAADPGAALVALEPGTGHVRAYVGGRDFFGDSPEAKFDLAGQGRRQTGSSFKPFVLAAALEAGVPLDRVYDAPARIEIPLGDGQPDWEVTNYDGSGSGRMNLVEATVHSVNTVYAQLVMDVGPERAVDMASRLGVVSPLQPYPSAALGTNGVTVLDMASAFATFAADGLQVDPVFVTRITTRDGTILYDASPRPERALSTTHARQVTEVLGQVVTRGRASTPASVVRSPARPAPPRSGRTPGSSATRPSSPPRCGSGSPTPHGPWSPR
ncbi:MAG: transglycosylase domain-containing protein [Acidimicrobiia bacterium]|nr:transglycosylase domain-containing protein [Acidimicrobiia bacterium]